jgi:hypothetical protein
MTVRRLNLKPDAVLGIIEATLTVLVGHREPLRPISASRTAKGRDRRDNALDEIITRVDVVDVPENLFGAKTRD